MHFLKDRGYQHPVASEITPQAAYLRRREWLRGAAAGATGLTLLGWSGRQAWPATGNDKPTPLRGVPSNVPEARTSEAQTPYDDVTQYNNFYEFGVTKEAPAIEADAMETRPWKVSIEGAVHKPRTFDIEDLLKLAPMEDRIYRLRCVEGWSMVIPWVGYSLAALLRQVEPKAEAKFVEFHTQMDPVSMPGYWSNVLSWPYVEGLRLDEAMHPLTLLAFGLYGEVLPNQNGAPVRLVVPWKYGFKSGKSLVKIRLVERTPMTTWNKAAPQEYGFFANVNPDVPHPRWSQASERRLGEGGVFGKRRKTLRFNGYEEQVGAMYAGLDLRKWF